MTTTTELFLDLRKRRSGLWSPLKLQRAVLAKQLSKLQLSDYQEFQQESHSAAVTCIAIDREEKRYLLAGIGDGTICVHNIYGEKKSCGFRSNVELRVGRTSRYKHSHSVETVSWYTDNGIFLTSGRDGKLKVWDSNEGVVVEQFTVGNTINKHRVADPDVGPLVAVANNTNHLQLVDLNTGSTCHTLRGHDGPVLTCTWSRLNSRILASGSADNKIMLWDVRQARSFLSVLDYNNVRFKRRKDIKLAGASHQSSVHGLEYSRCGRFLYSLGKDGRIRKWDTVTLKNMKTKFPEIQVKSKGSVDLACTEGGSDDYLFVPENNDIHVLNTISGTELNCLVGHYSSVYGLEYCEQNYSLYSCGRDRFVLQWDTPFHHEAARSSKVKESEETKDINPYTVDTWSSDEDDET